MPRRAEITPRPVIADPVYDSTLVTQLMNRVMRDGKKSTAEAIVYTALDKVGEKTGRPPVEVLEQAVKTVTPVLEVRSRRVGGANYQVPVEVPQNRGRTLALRWLVTFSRDRREKKSGKNPVEIFTQALSNVKPSVEVKSRRVGGANYQVPVEVRPVRRMALAMRWLREAAKKRGEKSMPLRLAGELIEASEGRGGAMKKREEVHRMAEANRAFAHFRF